ncbi:MAG: hypothetical protein AB7O91_11375 [Sphingomonas sp.]
MRRFGNFVAIDWSGARGARQQGIALAHVAEGDRPPSLLTPPGGWSREKILEWLVLHAEAGTDMIVGLDLSPALPFADRHSYFPGWPDSPSHAKALWQFVDRICGDEPYLAANNFVHHPDARRHFRHQGECGDMFEAGAGRMRQVEKSQRTQGLSPYSCFNLVGAAQVGKSSLTGMRVLHRLNGRIPFWPFDPPPERGPLLIEIYTALPAREAGIRKGSKIRDAATLDVALAALGSKPHRPLRRYDDHATDAILTAAWLRGAAARAELWSPSGLTPALARTEGWTFGVL